MNAETERVEFETKLFALYFIKHVHADLSLDPGVQEKAVVFARDDDDPEDYADRWISAMWFGWRARAGLL